MRVYVSLSVCICVYMRVLEKRFVECIRGEGGVRVIALMDL